MRTQILFLDDDASCLEHYRNSLASMASRWEMTFLTDAREALAAVAASRPAIVIADAGMLPMNGVAFLAEVERIHPQAQRLLAGDRDDEALFQSSIGSSLQFLPKPCTDAELITEIQRCVAIDSWLGNEKVKEVVARMGAFPSLPPMYLKVVNALNSRNASAEQIGQAISGDLAISAKVLQVVNSSYYGFEEKISDITQAVSILGVETVKSLVLAVQVFGKMGRDAGDKALADQLWHHSMSVAVAAKRLVAFETADDHLAEEAYTAGLLHDIGKLVMLTAAPEAFESARALAREKSIPQWQAEEAILGCNHAETGAYVLARWGMPATVVEAVALHHQPVNSSGSSFCALTATHVANALVWERHPGDEPRPDALPDARFLAEIGRAGDWDTWRDVASGKISEKKAAPARAFTLKRPEPDAREARGKPSVSESRIPSEAPESDLAAGADEPSQEPRKGLFAGIAAAAAAAAVAVGLFWILGSDKPKTEPALADAPLELKASKLSNLVATAIPDDAGSLDFADPFPAPAEDFAAFKAPVAPEPASAPHPEPKIAPKVAAFPELALNGIFYNPNNPAASVNGRILRVGDSISGAEIVRIEQKSVVVRHAGEERVFALK